VLGSDYLLVKIKGIRVIGKARGRDKVILTLQAEVISDMVEEHTRATWVWSGRFWWWGGKVKLHKK